MVYFDADTRRATARTDDVITQYSVGIPVKVRLSEDFDGLQKIMVFKSDTTEISRVLNSEFIEIPHEMMQTAGEKLSIGIYAANPMGTIVIPTIWAFVTQIRIGVVPGPDVEPLEPTPSWVAEVQEIALQAEADSTEALEKVNQALDSVTDLSTHIVGTVTHMDAQAAAAEQAATRAHTSEVNAKRSEDNAKAYMDESEEIVHHLETFHYEFFIEEGHLWVRNTV